jgi:hypothetical protein
LTSSRIGLDSFWEIIFILLTSGSFSDIMGFIDLVHSVEVSSDSNGTAAVNFKTG